MKRLVVAAVLMAASLLLCAGENIYIASVFGKIGSGVSEAAALFDSEPYLAARRAREVSDEWKDNTDIMSLFIPHGSIDDIMLELDEMSNNTTDSYEFHTSANTVLLWLEKSKNTERINFDGVF